ncbi:SurA N-terminal domain-containing protein [Flavobacteriaceae bacterium]|nr:SurA N-terminal domain-containing protein [Flavobacteriaceae bacterium]
MLQAMRDGAKGTTAKVIIGVIILSFAGFGLESILPSGSGTSVAEVNGTEISPGELQQAIDAQKRQLMQIFGERVDPAMLEDERLRPSALDTVIQRQLFIQQASALELVASDKEIGRTITAIEAFQLEGRFSPDQYKVVLANTGLSPERFRRSQAQDIVLGQLQNAILRSEFATSTELAAAANVQGEERDVRFLLIDYATIKASLDVNEMDVEAFYAANQARFVSEASVLVDYIELKVEDFFEPVPEAVLREQFEAVQDDYEVSAQARVAHILLMKQDAETAGEYQERIDEVGSRLDIGEDFAEVAADASDDVGSASFGGELGFTDGSAFPEAMEEAIAALAVGAISGPVETDAGTHFIRVEERLAEESADFELMREELALAIQQSAAQRELLSAVEALRDVAFNAPDLSGPSELIGVEVKQSTPISLSAGSGVFTETRLRETVFADEVYLSGNISDVIELNSGHFIAVRIANKIPAVQLPIASVSDEIRGELEANAMSSALAALTESLQTRLLAGESIEDLAKSGGYEWRVELAARRTNLMLPRAVLNTAFSIPVAATQSLTPVELPGEQLALVQLVRVRSGDISDLSDADVAQLSRETASSSQQMAFLEYRAALRNNAEVVTR